MSVKMIGGIVLAVVGATAIVDNATKDIISPREDIMQQAFNACDSLLKRCEKAYKESVTFEEKEKYAKELEYICQKTEELRAKAAKQRLDILKMRNNAIIALAAVGIGIVVKLGKK